MDKVDLLKLIEDDELGLLKVPPKKSSTITNDERLVESFHDINDFISKNAREPKPGGNVHEHTLYARLRGIRESKEKIKALLDLDEYGLLKEKMKEIKSMRDIFEDDTLGILENEADCIFEIKHVPKTTTMPSYIASRKPCNNFADYENIFTTCQSEIAAGIRKLWPFNNEQQIEKGLFFVLKGILLYIAEVGEREIIGGRQNARLHCIFENGTESDMLLRSLSAELYKDGRRVTETSQENIITCTSEDEKSGYIYILKSLSDKPEIQSIKNLYKIGFTKDPVHERIKNAPTDPTFLMAEVSVIAIFECYNMKPQKFEQLLQRFFGSVCLNIDIIDRFGKRYIPREWFVAPIDIIEQAIQFILSGDIIHYKYDSENQIIVTRSN